MQNPAKGRLQNAWRFFKKVEQVVSPECIIATNSTTIIITELSSELKYRDRCVSLHFFVQSPEARVCEVVKGLYTTEEVYNKVLKFVKMVNRQAIPVEESAGLISIRLYTALLNEACEVLLEGVGAGVEQQLETMLHAGNATPVREEILRRLHFGQGGGVAGGDRLNVARAQFRPQAEPAFLVADRRRALRRRADFDDILFVQQQVMRGRLRGHVDTRGPRRRDERDGLGAADVHKVQRTAGLAGQLEGLRDGGEFNFDGARREIGLGVVCAPGLLRGGEFCDEGLVFRVHCHQQAQLGRPLHAFVERLGVHAGKTGRSAVTHERLYADRAGGFQAGQLVEIARDESAPEREVRTGPLLGQRPLHAQAGGIEHGWLGVERQIEETRAATRREGGGARREAFPIAAAGFVELHVGVDDAGENMATGRVEGGFAVLTDFRCDLYDLAAQDAKVRMLHAVRRDQLAAPDDEIEAFRDDWRQLLFEGHGYLLIAMPGVKVKRRPRFLADAAGVRAHGARPGGWPGSRDNAIREL